MAKPTPKSDTSGKSPRVFVEVTYNEAAELDIKVTRGRVLRELDAHAIDNEGVREFFEEHGDHKEYTSRQLLGFLGY